MNELKYMPQMVLKIGIIRINILQDNYIFAIKNQHDKLKTPIMFNKPPPNTVANANTQGAINH